jgi:HSP20 family molecular chaperone IbpA
MSALRAALRDFPETVFADLLESDDAYLLVVDLPGASSETTDVTVEDGRVRIEARREKGYPPAFEFRQEERDLFLDAELPLPSGATDEGADASMDRGVLEVTLPKESTSEAVEIEIGDSER